MAAGEDFQKEGRRKPRICQANIAGLRKARLGLPPRRPSNVRASRRWCPRPRRRIALGLEDRRHGRRGRGRRRRVAPLEPARLHFRLIRRVARRLPAVARSLLVRETGRRCQGHNEDRGNNNEGDSSKHFGPPSITVPFISATFEFAAPSKSRHPRPGWRAQSETACAPRKTVRSSR